MRESFDRTALHGKCVVQLEDPNRAFPVVAAVHPAIAPVNIRWQPILLKKTDIIGWLDYAWRHLTHSRPDNDSGLPIRPGGLKFEVQHLNSCRVCRCKEELGTNSFSLKNV
ncbi:hypothetical protein [Paraburkholderia xenovorans]|uniref:hypothetical protein n=1 Tax=Paraburkholderia xenovorans TaxID=36873 RepID=UPI0038BBE612